MKESLFIEYIGKIFPKLQTIIERINGKRGNQLTYLHKTMLRKEYSADQKWESEKKQQKTLNMLRLTW